MEKIFGFVYACTNERGSLHPNVYGNCFVGKYFVIYFSTTKTTKMLTPEKYPLYGIYIYIIIFIYIFQALRRARAVNALRANVGPTG